ncbi:hypothetical protein [Cytobacillus sp. NCCP-133]|uniref:hypothetical protein n=1 Tax=Cytobacillus sp. NCCP-133 TaxID=766848 RepID=UPI002231B7EC|nr:hypothetical protein [Cytobacillus sp. NCCP-133]
MLANKELNDIQHLQQMCEEKGRLDLKLNWDSLRTRPDGSEFDFFQYDEQGKLIGFLALYTFGRLMELCSMVHPEHRQNGVFSHLSNRQKDQSARPANCLLTHLLILLPQKDSLNHCLALIPFQNTK